MQQLRNIFFTTAKECIIIHMFVLFKPSTGLRIISAHAAKRADPPSLLGHRLTSLQQGELYIYTYLYTCI